MAGEARYRLGPLSLPEGDSAGSVGSEAVALFAHRARQVDARFALDETTGLAVARLVARLDGIPLAIELAAARVEALGVTGLLDRMGDRFALLTAGDRLAAGRHRSLAATVEWSYRLLDERERRVFRAVSVFPGPFTLEGAEAVAGQDAGAAVLRLVDCSLLVPPRAGPDGRSRYGMLETLRAYGTGLLAEAGQADKAAAALAGWAVQVAEQASAGLQAAEGETAAAQWLDAEDATMRQVLAWAMEHDRRSRCGWQSRWHRGGPCAAGWRGSAAVLSEAARQAVPGSDGWCAAHFWLGMTAGFSADMSEALRHFTAVRDAVMAHGPSRVLADALFGRSSALRELDRLAEAAESARGALAVAREIGYPPGEALALMELSQAAGIADDPGRAVRLARQAEQIMDIPGRIDRACSANLTSVLIAAGDMAAAESVCAAGLARSRGAGSAMNLAQLLILMAIVDLQASRIQDAATHLREAHQIVVRAGDWFQLHNGLDCCGHLCVATGRPAEAITMWAAHTALCRDEGFPDWPADSAPSAATAARGPARARSRPDPGGRGPWRGDEPGRGGRVCPDAHRPRPAATSGAGPGEAQRPRTGAGHPGRGRPHRRSDRRRAVHQHPHRALAPGPDPGQDRLPAPRRPDPPCPQRGSRVARSGPAACRLRVDVTSWIGVFRP